MPVLRSLRYGPLGVLVNVAVLFVWLAGPAGAEEPVRILALGDSLTAGYGLEREASFPAQLETALRVMGKNVRVLNGGVSGDTTAGGLARLHWALGDGADMVIVELGANDGLRGLRPASTEVNLDAILTLLKRNGIPVLLTGMRAPPNLGRDYGQAFDAVFPRVAERHGAAFYPFFLDGVAARPELNQADGIHPTAEGIAVIVERILPKVLEVLGKVR